MGLRRRPKVPELEPLAAPQNAEERKERQRLHVKRTYYKKLNEMQNQRERVRQLEQQYARLVIQKKERINATNAGVLASKPTSPDSHFPTHPETTNHHRLEDDTSRILDHGHHNHFDFKAEVSVPAGALPAHDMLSKQAQYTEIAELKERLLAENTALRTAIAEHERFAHQLSNWITTEDTTDDEETVPFRRAELIKPLTLAFCQSFARQAYNDMWQFRQSRGFISSGLSVFGWRDKRLLEGNKRARFSLTKVFKGRTALELALRGWNVLSTAKSIESMFSASTNAKVVLVQHIDQHNKVHMRVMTSPDGMSLAKTLFLVTHFVIPTGFAVCLKWIDPKLLVPSQLPPGIVEKWVEHSSWVAFESAGDDGQDCQLEFSGEVQLNPLVAEEVWLLEILFFILRFEGNLTGPVFTLC